MTIGFPVTAVDLHEDARAGWGERLLGRFAIVDAQFCGDVVEITAAPSGVDCPMCHEPMSHLRFPAGLKVGRTVAGDERALFADVMPDDLRVVACEPCDLFFYERMTREC